jgi:hypothetical protein
MSVPYNDDTRESYIERMKADYLEWAEWCHAWGHERSVWLHLFTWVRCEEIYGGHWDDLKARGSI